MIVLNLVIGVIMNSMDESNAEMSIESEIARRKKTPNQSEMGLTIFPCGNFGEMQVIKKMIEKQVKADECLFHLWKWTWLNGFPQVMNRIALFLSLRVRRLKKWLKKSLETKLRLSIGEFDGVF